MAEKAVPNESSNANANSVFVGDNVRAEEKLTQLFGGTTAEQLRAIEQAGKSGSPLLLRALLWKHADGSKTISAAVTGAIKPHLLRMKNLLWREVGSPIPAVRQAAIQALKSVSGIKDIKRFFPLFDDYDVGVRERSRSAIREIVETQLTRIRTLGPTDEAHELLVEAYRVFFLLAGSSLSPRQQFALEMLIEIGIQSQSAFWQFVCDNQDIPLSLLAGEFVRRSDVDCRTLLYMGVLRQEERVRHFSLQTIGHLLVREPILQHLQILHKLSEEERAEIVRQLDRTSLLDKVIIKFGDLSLEKQKQVIRLLRYVSAEHYSVFLKDCLSHLDPEINLMALELLGTCEEPVPIPTDFSKMLASSSEDVVLRAVDYIAEKGTSESVSNLIPLLSHTSDEVARRVAQSIGRISEKILLAKYDSLDEKAADQVTKILHRLNPKIIEEIGSRLGTLSRKQKIQSVRILISLANEEDARKELEKLLSDDDPHVRASIAKGVDVFSGDRKDEILEALLQDEDPRVRANAVEHVPNAAKQTIVEVLFKLAHSRNGRERANALKKLWDMGYRGYELSVAQMIEDADPFVRSSGLWVAGEIQSPKLLQLAAQKLHDLNPVVRRNAVIAIKKRGTDEQVRGFFQMSNDADYGVRRAVADALRERVHLDTGLPPEPPQLPQE